MVAEHAKWPKENDIIFSLSERAQAAEKELGKDKVINATIGALMDDNGKLIAMKTVYDQLKNLPNEEISAYASIGGQPAYQEAVKKVCFKGNDPEGYIRVVASPGGSGAIKLAMYNYTNENDVVLVSDWYWSPYGIIGEETKRGVENYALFDESGNFNIDSYSEKFTEILNRQGRIFTIINSPGNNPTGYSLSDEDWDKVLDLAKEAAKDKACQAKPARSCSTRAGSAAAGACGSSSSGCCFCSGCVVSGRVMTTVLRVSAKGSSRFPANRRIYLFIFRFHLFNSLYCF